MPRRKAPTPDLEDLIDEEPPKTIDPYAVLEVAQDASADQIKSSYRKAALKHHPGTSPKSSIRDVRLLFSR